MFRLADRMIFNCAMQNRRMTTNGVGLLNIRPPVLTPYSDGSLLLVSKLVIQLSLKAELLFNPTFSWNKL